MAYSHLYLHYMGIMYNMLIEVKILSRIMLCLFRLGWGFFFACLNYFLSFFIAPVALFFLHHM